MSGLIKASTQVNTFQDPAKDFCKDGFQNFVKVPLVDVPYTTISKRAQMSDLSNDLMPRMGVERIMTQQLYRIAEESGPNGEPVFGVVGDKNNQIRFVGTWISYAGVAGNGVYPNSTSSYLEITCYGTLLNILTEQSTSPDWRLSFNGQTEGSNIAPTSNSVLNNRNYSNNCIFPISVTQTLGLNTYKLRINNTATPLIYGFEILNEAASLKVAAGTSYIDAQKVPHTLESVAYNSSFESGTLGTRGGRVLVYQKANGSIAKAVTPVDTSAAYLSSADHTNEEMVRELYPHMFGSGRADDFSLLGDVATSGVKAFSLDDNNTNLLATAGVRTLNGTAFSGEAINVDNANDYFTLTFYGSGIDIVIPTEVASASATFYIDGTSIGSYTASSTLTSSYIKKIASGLPLGTHTLKVVQTTSQDIWFGPFKIYLPKQPILPSGSISLGQYCLNADYVANSTAGTETIATGVVRKGMVREVVAVGTFGMTTTRTDAINGIEIYTNANGAYLDYTFVGTGFEYRAKSDVAWSSNITVSLNGTNLTTGNFATAVFSTYGGMSYSAPTLSVAVSTVNGAGFRCSGLPFGKYTVRFYVNTGVSMVFDSIDVITPIYFPSYLSSFEQQNTITLPGSINDLRKLAPVDSYADSKKLIAQAFGVTANPTSTVTSSIPMPDMSVTMNSDGAFYELKFDGTTKHSVAGNTVYLYFFVDGAQVGVGNRLDQPVAGMAIPISMAHTLYLAKGYHKIDVYWNGDAGTRTMIGNFRTFTVKKA